MRTPKEYFSDKTPEQIFSFCLLIGCVALMLFCAIVRLCGGLWFSADLSKVPIPSEFWQEVIKGVLLFIEALFVYKILCHTSWIITSFVAIAYVLLGILIGKVFDNYIISNIYYMLGYLLVPIIFVRKWYSLLDNIILYIIAFLYALLFLVGRIGKTENASYNFVIQVLTTIDYKLFFVSLYLFICNFGGIKLWKTQKRLIFQKDPKEHEI